MRAEDLLADRLFGEALAEIESVGFRVSARPRPTSAPYMVIGGRSNRRWWLIPLRNRGVTAGGMALFQPVNRTARWLKGMGSLATAAGIAPFMARTVLHVSGTFSHAHLFPERELSCAFFTGTAGPHRKSTVQVMDQDGAIRGYAKVTCNPERFSLLEQEAGTLRVLEGLAPTSFLVPSLLFHGGDREARVLVTDTRKTRASVVTTVWSPAHGAFERELAARTDIHRARDDDAFAAGVRGAYAAMAGSLPPEWHRRIERSLDFLRRHGDGTERCSLSHGDLTPWNTFLSDGKLYVFDWEHASHARPPGFDRMHFSLSCGGVAGRRGGRRLIASLLGPVDPPMRERARLRWLTCVLAFCCSGGRLPAPRDRGTVEAHAWRVPGEAIDALLSASPS